MTKSTVRKRKSGLVETWLPVSAIKIVEEEILNAAHRRLSAKTAKARIQKVAREFVAQEWEFELEAQVEKVTRKLRPQMHAAIGKVVAEYLTEMSMESVYGVAIQRIRTLPDETIKARIMRQFPRAGDKSTLRNPR